MSRLIEAVKNSLEYNDTTGLFKWIGISKYHAEKNGCIAGTKTPDGYIKIKINGKKYSAHRLAWLMIYGRLPCEIDHINGNKSDNRILNLREVTHQQNMMNHSRAMNGSGLPCGVKKSRKLYLARIKHEGVTKNLGSYNTPEEAELAYLYTRKSLFREYHYDN